MYLKWILWIWDLITFPVGIPRRILELLLTFLEQILQPHHSLGNQVHGFQQAEFDGYEDEDFDEEYENFPIHEDKNEPDNFEIKEQKSFKEKKKEIEKKLKEDKDDEIMKKIEKEMEEEHTGINQLPKHTGTNHLREHTGINQLPKHTGTNQLPKHTGTNQLQEKESTKKEKVVDELINKEVEVNNISTKPVDPSIINFELEENTDFVSDAESYMSVASTVSSQNKIASKRKKKKRKKRKKNKRR